ncbi:MAG TPA: complex I subunit 1 family protein [Kofleriaceae bacterium]|nr:complex I subunit 1 family protein [Kofleriaceae bacterium]
MDTVYAILDWPGTKWLLLIMLFVMPVASLLTWAERRQSAMMQDRRGPNRANIGPIKLWGILHFVADAIKMIGKEDYVPKDAHKPLFTLAPILALAPVLIAFAIIPFGPTIYPHELLHVVNGYALRQAEATGTTALHPEWTNAIHLQMYSVEFGLIFYFAILTLANYGATIAGWASYNKWALLGGLRASSQMMSYEVTMGLSLMGAFLVMGTLEPGAMVTWQGPNPLHWGWAVQPLAVLLFFTAAVAETKRTPFDLPEGEPEIIGYFVEYSGMRWGMFFLAEFIEIVFISMVMTTVFFGGYQFPFLYNDGFHMAGWVAYLPHLAVVLIQILGFGLKVVFFCWLQLAIRWTLPRFRPDQLMGLGWKKLLPLSLFNVMATAAVVLWLM